MRLLGRAADGELVLADVLRERGNGALGLAVARIGSHSVSTSTGCRAGLMHLFPVASNSTLGVNLGPGAD
jgi:hypothetical protein